MTPVTAWEHTPGPEQGTVRMQVLQRALGRLLEWQWVNKHNPDTPASAWTSTRRRFELFGRAERKPGRMGRLGAVAR